MSVSLSLSLCLSFCLTVYLCASPPRGTCERAAGAPFCRFNTVVPATARSLSCHPHTRPPVRPYSKGHAHVPKRGPCTRSHSKGHAHTRMSMSMLMSRLVPVHASFCVCFVCWSVPCLAYAHACIFMCLSFSLCVSLSFSLYIRDVSPWKMPPRMRPFKTDEFASMMKQGRTC
jgi:hypothetical protein